jgi:hypothetical protein
MSALLQQGCFSPEAQSVASETLSRATLFESHPEKLMEILPSLVA